MQFTTLGGQRPPPSLFTVRLIWAAMLLGQIVFLGIVAMGLIPGGTANEALKPILAWVSLGMLMTIVPIAGFIRYLMFSTSRKRSGQIAMQAYATGNLIFWAACEGVAFAGMVCAVINDSFWPTAAIAIVAMAAQVVTFPIGIKQQMV